MMDISVIEMIISVAAWRIYPSWVNDKLRSWEGFGHSGMFWARLSREYFRSKPEIISYLSRVRFTSKRFLFPALCKIWRQSSSAGVFGFDDVLEVFLKTPLCHRTFFANSDYTTRSILLKVSILLSKQSWFYLPDGYGDPQAEQSTLVMVRWKREWKFNFWLLARSSAGGLSWSKNDKNTTKSACDWAKSQPFIDHKTSEFWEACFRDRCRYHFALCCFVYVDVQQQVGQAAVRGQRRKAVIRDMSGVSHWGVTNLSAPIWFTGRIHCTVFRHMMQ